VREKRGFSLCRLHGEVVWAWWQCKSKQQFGGMPYCVCHRQLPLMLDRGLRGRVVRQLSSVDSTGEVTYKPVVREVDVYRSGSERLGA
jgi:hypothetical protein